MHVHLLPVRIKATVLIFAAITPANVLSATMESTVIYVTITVPYFIGDDVNLKGDINPSFNKITFDSGGVDELHLQIRY